MPGHRTTPRGRLRGRLRAPALLAPALLAVLTGLAAVAPLAAAANAASAASPAAANAATPAASPDTLTIGEVRIREVAAPASRALQDDPLARALAAGTWAAPAPGDTAWHRATADAGGWIADPRLARGHALATVAVPADTTLLLEASGYRRLWMDGHWREGNLYGATDAYQPWQPRFDFVRLPVRLRAGENTLIFHGNRFGRLRARFLPPPAPLALNVRDATVPDLVVGEATHALAAVVVMNATGAVVADAELVATLPGGEPQVTPLPPLMPWSVHKAGFALRGPAPDTPGEQVAHLRLVRGGRLLHTGDLPLAVKRPHENRRVTFRSALDGSVQYFGWLPAAGSSPSMSTSTGPGPAPAAAPAADPAADHAALILSLHGAAVEAINQSGSYPPLGWAHVVAPTNRRPYGFNWEDWGRRDALEVLDLVQRRLGTAADRTYLTGHSMGGHGAWHLGTLHPDRFAAVAPSAGWISFWSYRPDRDAAPESPLSAMLARASLPSRTLQHARNLAGLGVYVLHGADDRVVSVDEARTMREHLAGFHRDVDFHEEPGAGHWWDAGDGPGADCVAWPPLLDFLTRHRRPAAAEVRHVRFTTPAPGVTARHRWATVERQHRAFVASTLDLRLDPAGGTLTGTTENVALLRLDLAHVAGDSVLVALDGDTLRAATGREVAVVAGAAGVAGAEGAVVGEGAAGALTTTRALRLARPAPDAAWQVATAWTPAAKGPHRDSGLRTAFDRRVQFVFATGGTAAQNAWARARARQDAEHLWYQGNAAVSVLPDTLFHPDAEPHRNLVLYGNASTHAHWDALWSVPDLHLDHDALRVGDRVLTGPGLGLLAIAPRPGSPVASVAVIGGTGLPGRRLTDRRPYLAPGVAYPDLTILEDRDDTAGTVVRAAGFLGPDWSLTGGELIWDDRAIDDAAARPGATTGRGTRP